MEAGNGMPFQLKQLLHMSTSFKTLGKSCKCSSNEIDLSATSKQIPAAPKCLFAVRLNGDCVKSSAFKGTCQEKFRSSTRQWHRNAAVSKIFANIKPEKKPLPSSFFIFSFSLIRPYNFLASPCMRFFAKAALTSYKGKYVRFLTGTFEDGLLVGHRPPSHSTASLASQDPQPVWLHQQHRLVVEKKRGTQLSTQGLQYESTALRDQWTAWSPTRPDCQADSGWFSQSLVKQSTGAVGLYSCPAKPP